jgi:hypothetical protein
MFPLKNKISLKEMVSQFNEFVVRHKDKEEEKKLNPAWKKLRPNKDAINYRLPGGMR